MKKTVYFIFTLVLCVVTFNLITISNAEAKVNDILIHGIGAYEAANRMGAIDSFKKGGYNKKKEMEWYYCKVGLVTKISYDTIIYADKSGYVKAISFYYLNENKKAEYPKIRNCIMNLYGDMDKAMADVDKMEKCLAKVMTSKESSFFKSKSEDCFYYIIVNDDRGVVRLTIMCGRV